jgi:hypothetical protein
VTTGRGSKCGKGCCWTPQDVCAKHGDCKCHMSEALREDAERGGISLDELLRRDRLREKSHGD